MQPLVTIGVPTYNRPVTLERTLKCLVNQSYQNLEIIVSDNGSSDPNVEETMKQFIPDPRIKYYKQPFNKGSIFNFNFVLENATGSFFMRLADDDWLDLNYIQDCVSFLLQNQDYIGAYGRTGLYSLDGKFVKFDTDLNINQKSYVERMINFYQYVTQNGAYFSLLRTEYCRLVFVKPKLADDWLGVARLIFEGKIKVLPDTNLNLSQGGVGSSIDDIVKFMGLSKFNKYFPHLSIAINAFMDILWQSKVYRKINFFKRFSLAATCAKTIYNRFNVKNEIRGAYRSYLKAVLFSNS